MNGTTTVGTILYLPSSLRIYCVLLYRSRQRIRTSHGGGGVSMHGWPSPTCEVPLWHNGRHGSSAKPSSSCVLTWNRLKGHQLYEVLRAASCDHLHKQFQVSAQTFPKGATYASEQARALEKAKQDVAGGADDVNLLCYNACRNGHVDAAKWLVGEGGVDINIARNNGITPLYIACEKGQMAGGQRHGRRRHRCQPC